MISFLLLRYKVKIRFSYVHQYIYLLRYSQRYTPIFKILRRFQKQGISVPSKILFFLPPHFFLVSGNISPESLPVNSILLNGFYFRRIRLLCEMYILTYGKLITFSKLQPIIRNIYVRTWYGRKIIFKINNMFLNLLRIKIEREI